MDGLCLYWFFVSRRFLQWFGFLLLEQVVIPFSDVVVVVVSRSCYWNEGLWLLRTRKDAWKDENSNDDRKSLTSARVLSPRVKTVFATLNGSKTNKEPPRHDEK